MILSFPTPGISFLAWIAFVPLFIILMEENFIRALFSSILMGVLFNTVYLFWMKEYKHPASLSGGVFLEMLFFVSASLLSRFLYRNVGKSGKIFFLCDVTCFVLGWFALDYVKTIGFLAFPWGILGYTQYKNLKLIQSASLFGLWGVHFVLLYFNAAIACMILSYAKIMRMKRCGLILPGNSIIVPIHVIIHISLASFFLVLSLVYGWLVLEEWRHKKFPEKKVAAIQGNFDPWSPDLANNIEIEISLTMEALRHNPDLIIWSESSAPFPYELFLNEGNRYARRIHNFISGVGKPFIFGSIEFVGQHKGGKYIGDFYNVAVYYNEGLFKGTYRKIHLVPFGEWFPYKRLFPFVARILEKAEAGDFVPGSDFLIFRGEDFSFSVLICFEDVFGNLARKFVLGGSEILINVTNDAWTGSRKAEIQHFSKSIFRAIENRRSLIRAANGGITASISPYGEVLAQLEPFTTSYLICKVPVVEKEVITFYTKHGDFLPIIIFFFVSSLFLFYLIKKILTDLKLEIRCKSKV
ncbi:MAG: apolipoprotein N-acyltransferase [Spirochaetota bacterium]